MPFPNKPSILCIGELLFDSLPAGIFLGGAPLNVAVHLARLGETVQCASAVGDDQLGAEARRRLPMLGLSPDLLQIDKNTPTGLVTVDLSPGGEPSYTFNNPAAWDRIAMPNLTELDERPNVLIHGTLAQRRAEASRTTIQQLASQEGFYSVFDINLRQPFVYREVVDASLAAADMIKLNHHELTMLAEWHGLPTEGEGERGVSALADAFGLDTICLTRGEKGAALWHEGIYTEVEGVRVEVADTVGAGDAFLAGLLHKFLNGTPPAEALDFANRLGALVASRHGATPPYDVAEIG